ncbi:hypothetical protein OC834_007259 [Tilletia horrida]|nr:hypothetical protein OC834_007259 [Tilletia horrida]
MRSHFRAQRHPKAMPASTVFQKAGTIVLVTVHFIALAATYVGIVATGEFKSDPPSSPSLTSFPLSTGDFALNSVKELLAQRCGSPIPLAVAHCATHKASIKIAIALIVLLIALAAILVFRLVCRQDHTPVVDFTRRVT